MPVTVVAAKEADVTEKIPVVGSLAAREEVQVYPLIEGRAIMHILVEVGQKVKKGQPLALLDQTETLLLLDKNAVSGQRADAAVAVEASRLDVAMVTLKEALKVVERSRALQPKGAVSQQVLDEHENAYARAVAECALAQQSLSLAKADAALIARERDEIELSIERSTVRAPESGMVLRRTARIGAMTSISANPLFVLAKDAAVEFVAQVTETSFARLGEGMPAEISVAGYDGAINGTVRLNAAELDPVTRSGEVRIDLGGVTSLKPGMFARGSINALARRNIVLPGSAVTTAGGKSNVFVVDNDVVDLRSVTIGARQDGLVEILGGVREGEMVVVKSGAFLKADEKVRPIMASSAQLPSDHLAASFAIRAMETAR
jgi:RND family efflux transporter MFP subunit